MTDRFEDFVTTDKDFDFVDEEAGESNRDRAHRAAAALRSYMAHFPEDVEVQVEDAAASLVTDLLHLLDGHEQDVEAVLEQGVQTWLLDKGYEEDT